MRPTISIEKRVAIALYSLGSSGEYRSISNMFGVGKSTVCEIVLEFCETVYMELKREYINDFPLNSETIKKKVQGFNALGFPQCLGAIDGCHIEIRPRGEDAVDYYNYKGWYSTILLALVDASYKFMYINVGAPGRCNDSAVYEHSSLSKCITQCDLLKEMKKNINGVEVPIFIIGDSAFKLSTTLLKPYPFSMHNSNQPKIFNYNLSKCRRVVENAFGQLKARFRRIGKGVNNNIKNANKIIKACCILHNFFKENNDDLPKRWTEDYSDVRDQPDDLTIFGNISTPAEQIRETLARYFALRDVVGNSSADGVIAGDAGMLGDGVIAGDAGMLGDGVIAGDAGMLDDGVMPGDAGNPSSTI